MAEQDQPSDGFAEHAARAGDALSELADVRAADAAAAIEDAFADAGSAIESSLTRAARAGEDVFAAMARSVLSSLSDLAIDKLVEGPLAAAVGGVLGKLPLPGLRADGGPVVPGGAYLVGERGPELFVPAGAGAIEPASTGAVSVHFHLTAGADAEALRRSQGQIATLVARAVARGRKRL